jgi:hypothetical protein
LKLAIDFWQKELNGISRKAGWNTLKFEKTDSRTALGDGVSFAWRPLSVDFRQYGLEIAPFCRVPEATGVQTILFISR